jgi:hypothetical protein
MRRVLKLLPLLIPLLALVLLAAKFVGTMNHRAERVAASNSVKLQQPVIQINGGSQLCQSILAPRDAASAMFFLAPTTPKGPPMSLTLTAGGRTIATSRIAGGWTGGTPRFPFRTLDRTYTDAEAKICARNEGRAPIAFSGLPVGAPTSTTVDGKAQKAVVTVQFFRPGTSTWWELLPTIAHRAGVLKGSLAGSWAFWVAAALVLLAGVSALAITLRSWAA